MDAAQSVSSMHRSHAGHTTNQRRTDKGVHITAGQVCANTEWQRLACLLLVGLAAGHRGWHILVQPQEAERRLQALQRPLWQGGMV